MRLQPTERVAAQPQGQGLAALALVAELAMLRPPRRLPHVVSASGLPRRSAVPTAATMQPVAMAPMSSALSHETERARERSSREALAPDATPVLLHAVAAKRASVSCPAQAMEPRWRAVRIAQRSALAESHAMAQVSLAAQARWEAVSNAQQAVLSEARAKAQVSLAAQPRWEGVSNAQQAMLPEAQAMAPSQPAVQAHWVLVLSAQQVAPSAALAMALA